MPACLLQVEEGDQYGVRKLQTKGTLQVRSVAPGPGPDPRAALALPCRGAASLRAMRLVAYPLNPCIWPLPATDPQNGVLRRSAELVPVQHLHGTPRGGGGTHVGAAYTPHQGSHEARAGRSPHCACVSSSPPLPAHDSPLPLLHMPCAPQVSGAVMGTTPGGEFVAAVEAAREQGAQARPAAWRARFAVPSAQHQSISHRRPSSTFSSTSRPPPDPTPQVVLGDREQAVTMARLLHYTRFLTHQDSRRAVRCSQGGGWCGLGVAGGRLGGVPEHAEHSLYHPIKRASSLRSGACAA